MVHATRTPTALAARYPELSRLARAAERSAPAAEYFRDLAAAEQSGDPALLRRTLAAGGVSR